MLHLYSNKERRQYELCLIEFLFHNDITKSLITLRDKEISYINEEAVLNTLLKSNTTAVLEWPTRHTVHNP